MSKTKNNLLAASLVIFFHGCAAVDGGSSKSGSVTQGALPDCGGCGIDFDEVRRPLLEYARAMGPDADYEFVTSTLGSSYGCPAPPESESKKFTMFVRGQQEQWRIQELDDEIRCVAVYKIGGGAVLDDEGFAALSRAESTIFLTYLNHPFRVSRRVTTEPRIRDYCEQLAPSQPGDLGRFRMAQPVEFDHPSRRLLLQHSAFGRQMLLHCSAENSMRLPGAEGVDITAAIRPFRIDLVGGSDSSEKFETAVVTWVSTRGNVVGIGNEVDVSGLLRGGAQQLFAVFGNQVPIEDPEDVDLAAIKASALGSYGRDLLVGLGPWGELDFPHGRVCIKDMQGPHCSLAVRWDTDQASLPVLRHVASGETLGEGPAGSVSLQLDGAASVQRVELLDSTSRILDRKTAQVVESAGEISAAQPRCATSPTTAGPDATTCMVELLWSTEYAPEATLWKVSLDPPAAPVLLGRADQGTTLVDQIQANTSIVYELRQMGTFSSGLLASAKVVGEVANQ